MLSLPGKPRWLMKPRNYHLLADCCRQLPFYRFRFIFILLLHMHAHVSSFFDKHILFRSLIFLPQFQPSQHEEGKTYLDNQNIAYALSIQN